MNGSEKIKLIRDPIYGYISIRENYFRDFIDTPIFQRLRQVEQTSMRVLYPAAHHDRFAHSLGVYHLAAKLFRSLEDREEFGKELRSPERIRHSFEFAALLHDCAHFAFSHTGEEIAQKIHSNRIEEQLLAEVNNNKFAADYVDANAAIHELTSALIVLKVYAGKIKEYGADPELVVRMIIGCQHQNPVGQDKIENCLISLINGQTIDVDKLDYLTRDTWATGVDNAVVDLDRLIPSICLDLDDNKGCIVISKQSCSVVNNVCQARDFLYQWIVCHHKVQQDQSLVKRAIRLLGDALGEKTGQKWEKALEPLFSWESLIEPQAIGDLETIYLPADGDIRYLMKKYCGDDETVKELLGRGTSQTPLWKTYIEFCHLFKKHLSPDTVSDGVRLEQALADIDDCKSIGSARKKVAAIRAIETVEKSWTANVTPFLKRLNQLNEEHQWGRYYEVNIKTSIKSLASLAVRLGDEKITYGELFGDHQLPVSLYGYLFAPKDAPSSDIISILQKEARIIAGKETE